MKQPFINFSIGGKIYEHKLTIRGISTLGQAGIDINQYIVNDNKEILLYESLSILFVSLQGKTDDMDIDKYIDMLEDADINFVEISNKAREIVVNAYPDKKEKTESPNSATAMNAQQQTPSK